MFFFSVAFSDKEVLFNNKSLKHEALSIFLHIRWSCKPPLCLLWNNINVTQIAYFTLSSVFFNLSKLLFGQRVETAQPLFNDELAFFIISIKLIVVVIISTSKFGELWSPARQQLWPGRRSKVKVKVTARHHLKGLVTRNMHDKYQCSIFNNSEDMSQVKVFVTDRRTDGQRDGRMRFNVPTLSRKRGTIKLIVVYVLS